MLALAKLEGMVIRMLRYGIQNFGVELASPQIEGIMCNIFSRPPRLGRESSTPAFDWPPFSNSWNNL